MAGYVKEVKAGKFRVMRNETCIQERAQLVWNAQKL